MRRSTRSRRSSEAVGGRVEAVGFGIPCTFDSRTGMAVQAVNLPLDGHRVRRRDGRAARAARRGRQRRQLRGLGRGARGRRRRARPTSRCSRSAPGSAAGCCCGGELYRGWISGAAPRWGTWSSTSTAAPCQGNCPNWGCLESVASGSALVREASLRGRARARHALGPRAGGGARADRAADHRAGDRRRPGGARGAIEMIGRALGVGIANLVNIFNPRGRRDRRRRDRGGRAAARAGARGHAASARCRRRKDVVRVEAARVRRRGGDDRRGAAARATSADGGVTGAIEARPP